MDIQQLRLKIGKCIRQSSFLLSLYALYWKIKMFIDYRKKYPSSTFIFNNDDYPVPTLKNITSQMCTSNQFFEEEYRKWCSEMHSPPRFSRKQWEYVFILEALHQAGMIQEGKRGLGFGCGKEPLTAVMAKYGCNITATDIIRDEKTEKLWVNTYQHADSISGLNEIKLCDPKIFNQQVEFKYVDMNHVPDDLIGYDFLWAACALEHLGSIQHGLDFVTNALKCLKSGGVAIHTTEFNLSSNDETFECENLAIFRKKEIDLLLEDTLLSSGAEIKPLNLNTGIQSIDQFVDTPPYRESPHLKFILCSYITTSLGLIIKKNE